MTAPPPPANPDAPVGAASGREPPHRGQEAAPTRTAAGRETPVGAASGRERLIRGQEAAPTPTAAGRNDPVGAASGREPPHRGQEAAPTQTAATRYLVTCEHGGNLVGPRYRDYFAEHQDLLASHRGFDSGALVLARQMARALGAPLVASMTSRLVVDLNRSIGHPRLHAPQICQAPPELRDEILGRYYRSYRRRAERTIAAALEQGHRLIHLSSHSFTPVLGKDVRRADIGLLYDPERPGERHLCERWKRTLHAHAPGLVVRRNYPYTGKSDGFCTYLRRRFPADRYIGIELEINQKHVFEGGRHWRSLRGAVVAALLEALHGPSPFGS